MIIETQERPKFLDSLILPLFAVMMMWTIHIIGFVGQLDLGFLGVYPQHIKGLLGILTAPFIHGDWQHLTSNTFPFLFLSWTIVYFYNEIAYRAIGLIYILTGLMVWIFARPVYHIGASGVVYGLVAFVFWSGIFIKDVRAIVLSLIVTTLYSGMFLGVLPNQEGISWESHLYGGLVGIVIAFSMRSSIVKEEKVDWEEENTDDLTYFIARDTFEKTKQERAIEAAQITENQQWNWNSDITE